MSNFPLLLIIFIAGMSAAKVIKFYLKSHHSIFTFDTTVLRR